MSLANVVLGASPKEERYSNQAVRLLTEYGHQVIPIHPKAQEIAGVPVVSSLDQITQPVDTVSIYLSPPRLRPLISELIKLSPRRAIFSPGTEDEQLEESLRQAGIEVIEGCSLVMIRTNQF